MKLAFFNSLFSSSAVCPCLYEFMHQGYLGGFCVADGRAEAAGAHTVSQVHHSSAGSSGAHYLWQLKRNTLPSKQTKANCINRTCTCGNTWSQNMLGKFICLPDSDRHFQIKIKCVAIITQKLSEWIFTAA